MWAHIQTVGRCERQCSGLIRIFEDGQEFGEPYRYAFPFRVVDDETIEIYGVAGRAPTASEARAMLRAVRERGWRVSWRRVEGARPGKHEM
jgi:hypothetical protein